MFSATEIRMIIASIAITYVIVYATPMKLLRGYFLQWLEKTLISGQIYALIYEGLGCFWCLGFWVGLVVSLCMGYGMYAPVYGCIVSFINRIIRWRITL